MNILYNLALLLILQFPFACNEPLEKALAHKIEKAGAEKIVFKSTDGGQTWQDISSGLPENLQGGDFQGVGFFANDNGLFLRAGNGIYHSKPNSTGPFWEKEIFNGNQGSIASGKTGIFAYNSDGQFLQKRAGTSVWSPMYTNFQQNRVHNIYETAAGTVFIGTDQGLFKSTNSGKTWKHIHAGVGKLAESNGVLVTTNQKGISRSTDDGENWDLVISEGGVGIDVASIQGGFAAISYSTISKTRRIRTSYDGGKTWQAIDAGLQANGFIDSKLPPVNTNLPAQGFSDSTWHPKETSALSEPTYITTIIQVNDNFFCGHTDGIYRSSDKGKTWKLLLPSENGKMFKLSVSGNVIYAIQMESHC